jgi:hypothetical protein
MDKSPITNTCGLCIYCDSGQQPGTFVCRKNAPIAWGTVIPKMTATGVETTLGAITCWPQILPASDWCGEFTTKKKW